MHKKNFNEYYKRRKIEGRRPGCRFFDFILNQNTKINVFMRILLYEI
jgi:hypothetical protein